MGGECESCSQVFDGLNGLQAFDGIRGHGLVRRRNEVGVGLMVRAADPAAQLIQLRQAKAVGAVHYNGVGVGHVDAGLDNSGANENIETMVIKVGHDSFQVAFAHLAVGDGDAGIRHQF